MGATFLNNFWDTQTVEVLLNPRINPGERKRYTRLLKQAGLKAHLWLATSGTTAGLKFVALSKEAIFSSATSVNTHFNVTKKDIWINVLPTFHVGGLGILARGIQSGASVVDLYAENKRWNPLTYIEAVRGSHATLSALVPTHVYDLVSHNLRAPHSLRAVIVGGGALDRSLLQEASVLGWPLHQSYGLTECSSQVATCQQSDSIHAKILDHVELCVDEKGFIRLRSPSLLTCYAMQKDGAMVFQDPKQQGWFYTDDMGERKGDCLAVFGRGADFLKVGGESVSLQKAQRDLDLLKKQFNLKQDMVVTSKSDARLGSVVVLVSEGEKKAVGALIEEYNARVLPYERIHEMFFVQKIPRNAMNKPVRDLLRKCLGGSEF